MIRNKQRRVLHVTQRLQTKDTISLQRKQRNEMKISLREKTLALKKAKNRSKNTLKST